MRSAVFLVGTGFAVCSLLLSQNVPGAPVPGNEVLVGRGLEAEPQTGAAEAP